MPTRLPLYFINLWNINNCLRNISSDQKTSPNIVPKNTTQMMTLKQFNNPMILNNLKNNTNTLKISQDQAYKLMACIVKILIEMPIYIVL